MRAVVATRPGPPDVLEVVERPDLAAGPDEVVVAVTVAATTFIDTQVRAGRGPRPLPPEDFPVVLGNGVAGTVVDLGPGVEPAWLGARVVTSTGGTGGYATEAVAAVADLHRIPEDVDDERAVALLADGRTALSLARAAAIRPGDVVVVCAAAGGVGSLLVQLAREAGATVIGLAGSDAKRKHAVWLGADHALDYGDEAFPRQLDGLADGLDVVFDGVGGSTSAVLAARVGEGGRYLQHGAASGAFGVVDAEALAARGARAIPLFALPSEPATLFGLVEEALEAAAVDRLFPTVGQRVPFDRAAEAHAAMEAREVIGKTLLLP